VSERRTHQKTMVDLATHQEWLDYEPKIRFTREDVESTMAITLS